MGYIKELPIDPTFVQNGLKGYGYDINNSEIEINFVNCFKGHDKYVYDKESTLIIML